ncbi:MAG: hypothetical protein AB1772_06625 [Candidatus Zixiibacteriota bacterium]
MYKKLVLSLMAAALAVWAAGCSDNPVQNDNNQAVADEFGGYTATDESPAFGDASLTAAEAEEEEIDDPILAVPSVQEVVNDVDAGIFHFRAVWGRIPYDSTVTVATDWTGSLTISRGAIVLRRLIRFELNQDTYLPRTDRKLLEWVSFTTVHNDGIAVDIFVPPVRPEIDSSWVPDGMGDSTLVVDTIFAEPVTLTFATGPYTRTFTLPELAALQEIVSLDDGNKVAFHSIQMLRQVCPRGMLAGRWGYDEAGNGVFRGMWMSALGRVTGYLEGRFGQDDQGAKVFFGKWIDRDGRFEGLLRGVWGHGFWATPEEIEQRRAGGWFMGRIFDANANPIGVLGGHFGSAPDYQGGWFQGRWKLDCPRIMGMDDDRGMMEDGFGARPGLGD